MLSGASASVAAELHETLDSWTRYACYRVDIAAKGLEALAKLESATPDIVLSRVSRCLR